MFARWGEAFTQGARLFDAGAFFEAHEAWEALWLAEREHVARRVLQGLIQIAAGYHQYFVKGRPDSAARLLQRGLAKLTIDEAGRFNFSSFCDGVRANVATLSSADKPLVPADVPHFALQAKV